LPSGGNPASIGIHECRRRTAESSRTTTRPLAQLRRGSRRRADLLSFLDRTVCALSTGHEMLEITRRGRSSRDSRRRASAGIIIARQVDRVAVDCARSAKPKRLGGAVPARGDWMKRTNNGGVTGVHIPGRALWPCPVRRLAGGAPGWVRWSLARIPIPAADGHGEVRHALFRVNRSRLFILTARHGPIAPRRT